ncbi:hypothetical protein BDW68DRAFT_173464 [Aspergillus falconensis]
MAAADNHDDTHGLDYDDPSETTLEGDVKGLIGAPFAPAFPPTPRPRLPYFRRQSGTRPPLHLDSPSPPPPERFPSPPLPSPPKVVIPTRKPTGMVRRRLSSVLSALGSALGLGEDGNWDEAGDGAGDGAEDGASAPVDPTSALRAIAGAALSAIAEEDEAEAEAETGDANGSADGGGDVSGSGDGDGDEGGKYGEAEEENDYGEEKQEEEEEKKGEEKGQEDGNENIDSDEAGEQKRMEKAGTQPIGLAWNFAAPEMRYYTETGVTQELDVGETRIKRGPEEDEDEVDETDEAGEARASAESNSDGQLPDTTTFRFYDPDVPLPSIEDGDVRAASPSPTSPEPSWLSSDGRLPPAGVDFPSFSEFVANYSWSTIYSLFLPKQTDNGEDQSSADSASGQPGDVSPKPAQTSLPYAPDQPLATRSDDRNDVPATDFASWSCISSPDYAPTSPPYSLDQPPAAPRDDEDGGADGGEYEEDRGKQEAQEQEVEEGPIWTAGIHRPLESSLLNSGLPAGFNGSLFIEASGLPSMPPPPAHGPYRPLLDQETPELHVWEDEDDQSLSAQDNDTALLFRDPDLPTPSIKVDHDYDYDSFSSSDSSDIPYSTTLRFPRVPIDPNGHGTNANNDQSKRRSDSARGRASSPSEPSNSDSSDGTHISFSGRRSGTKRHSSSSGNKENIPKGNTNRDNNGDNNDNDGQRPPPRRVYSKLPVNTDLPGLYSINGSTTEEGTEDTEGGYEEQREEDPPGLPRGGPGGGDGGPPGPTGDPPEGDDNPDRFLEISPDPPTPTEYPESPVLPDFGDQNAELSPDPPTPGEGPESQPATVASTSRWPPAPSVPPQPPSWPVGSRPRRRIVDRRPGKPTVPDALSSNSGPRPSKRQRKRDQREYDGDYVYEEEEEDDDPDDDIPKGPPRGLGGRKRKSPSQPSPPPTSKKKVLRHRTIGFSLTETSALKQSKKRVADPSSDAGAKVINDVPAMKCSVYVLGENGSGQLGMGNGTPAQYKQPTKNTQLSDVVQVAAGGEHCIALSHDNKIYTWGNNNYGQLGRLTDSTTDPIPGEVDFSKSSLPNHTIFTQVVATRSACFVLTMFGDVYGWGTFSELYEDEHGRQNSDALGFRHRGKCQHTPHHIQELKNVKQLAAGSDHVLAQITIPIGGNKASSGAGIAPKSKGLRSRKRRDTVAADGSTSTAGTADDGDATKFRDVVRSWGTYKRGQLGRTAANDANCLTPLLCDFSGNSSRAMKYPDSVTTIGSGKFHSFVIKESGNILAWGYNKFTQTGIVPPAASSVLRHDSKVDRPGTVTSLAGQRANCPTGGVDFSIVVTEDGRCLSWGSIQDGLLGIPDTAMPGEVDIIKVAGPNGDGTQIPAIVKVPTSVPGLNGDGSKIEMVSAGWTHTVAVTKGGKALGWGSNDHYEIHPDKTKHSIKDAVEIPMKGLRVVEAAAGRFFTILLVQSE